jgi:uncharacterized membrane protein YphA (DoxX/SURF4 family)
MHTLLWVLQVLTAVLYAASGVMKAFLFDKVSVDVPSFGALPKRVWIALGLMELVCTLGLIVPGLVHWQPRLTGVAAVILALESVLFVWVHVRYHETGPIVMSAALGLVMAFIAYGRFVLRPLE